MCALNRAVLYLALCASAAVPVSASAEAECLQWDMSGRWDFVQGNGFVATFDLHQTGGALQGTGRYSGGRGPVEGTVGQSGFEFAVHWNNGSIGIYSSHIDDPSGELSSSHTHDQTHPGHRVYWTTRGRASCVKNTEETPAPPPPAPPPPPSSPPQQQSSVGTWLGIWDTTTGEGAAYTLSLSIEGTEIVGAAGHRDRRFDGTFKGTPNATGNELTFTFTQPTFGITSRGQLQLTSKDSFEGHFTKDNVPNTSFYWRGTRRP